MVMSSIGAMFAPHHQAVADELVRVCRPGGTIGLLSWTPEGMIGALFRTIGQFAPPPPPGAQPPPLWGSEDHLRELLRRPRRLRNAATGDVLEITAFQRRTTTASTSSPTTGRRSPRARTPRRTAADEFDAGARRVLRRVEPRRRRSGALRAGVPARGRHPRLSHARRVPRRHPGRRITSTLSASLRRRWRGTSGSPRRPRADLPLPPRPDSASSPVASRRGP